MSKKFLVLSFLSVLIRLVGGLLLLFGMYYGVYTGIIGRGNIMELGAGMLALFFGIMSLIVGESIGVLLAIEKNTGHALESEQMT